VSRICCRPGWGYAALGVKKKLVIGREYDKALRHELFELLAELGAEIAARQWGLGGSQILETAKVSLGKDTLVVEAETYIGLTLSGEARVVDRVAALLAARTNKA
jgi:hypothetical protein